MRKEFSVTIERSMLENEKMIFLTGDLGFMALESIQKKLKKRFINVGVSEQNMIAMAAGLASEGYFPLCYSIAPFAVFRPAEQIRLDVCLHNMNVKIVGNGGGYGYGIMGATHHAIEDIAVISSFQNMRCYIPFCNEDVACVTKAMMKRVGPSYLRLGYGSKPKAIGVPPYKPVRKLLKGNRITVVCMGPVILNMFKAVERLNMNNILDVFIVSEMPLGTLPPEIKRSIKKTGKIMVIEEHVKRGGLGENLTSLLFEEEVSCRYLHLYAKGYPNGLYGSQKYHQRISGLDEGSIADRIKELINEG